MMTGPSLAQVSAKVDEIRKEQESVRSSLPNKVVIGMFSISLVGLKQQLHQKHEDCVRRLLELVAKRAKCMSESISKSFSVVHGKLDDPPKDIEQLTETSEFLAGIAAQAATLQEQIGVMADHYDMLDELQFETPDDAFSAR
eukprot:6189805-Pleurochrysis_carterae.AAC.1